MQNGNFNFQITTIPIPSIRKIVFQGEERKNPNFSFGF